jgi:hypothetical protein
MKLLSRSEVLTVPEGVSTVSTSRCRLRELLKRSGAKVAPLAVAAASVRIQLLSRLRLEPPPAGASTGGIHFQLQAAARGRLHCVRIFSFAWHLDLRVAGGVLHCEPRTMGQAPPVPVVLGLGRGYPVWSEN